MITTRERAKLRALAQKLDPVVQIGKGGITESVIEGTKLVLEKRELVKIRLLNNSGLDTKEAMQVLCAWLGADPVQQIGSVLVIYKLSTHKDAKHVLWFLSVILRQTKYLDNGWILAIKLFDIFLSNFFYFRYLQNNHFMLV